MNGQTLMSYRIAHIMYMNGILEKKNLLFALKTCFVTTPEYSDYRVIIGFNFLSRQKRK